MKIFLYLPQGPSYDIFLAQWSVAVCLSSLRATKNCKNCYIASVCLHAWPIKNTRKLHGHLTHVQPGSRKDLCNRQSLKVDQFSIRPKYLARVSAERHDVPLTFDLLDIKCCHLLSVCVSYGQNSFFFSPRVTATLTFDHQNLISPSKMRCAPNLKKFPRGVSWDIVLTRTVRTAWKHNASGRGCHCRWGA